MQVEFVEKYKMREKTEAFTGQENEKCIGCRKCMVGCPMLDKFCENPKDLLETLSKEKEFSKELPYSCMICGYCEEVCPVDVSFNDIFFAYRKDLEHGCKGNLPKELNLGGVEFHQNLSFSKLFSKRLKKDKATVFFPGCALMGAKSREVLKVNSYLDKKLDGCEIMTHCCGKPTKYMGKDDKFNLNIDKIQSELDKKGIVTVVAGCINCYKTLQESLENVEVKSLWTVLDENGVVEDLGLDYSELGIMPTVHDPCPSRDNDDIHMATRNILTEMGISYHEMDLNKRETLCCGAGAMVSISQKEIADSHMKRRCSESKSDQIVTYCQECTESFKKQGVEAIHILELLFGDYDSLDFKESKLIAKWGKRFVLSNWKR